MPSTDADPEQVPTTTPPVFFVHSLESVSDEVFLDGAEGRHAATVRRLRIGETLRISDGHGVAIDGRVIEVVENGLRMAVLRRVPVPVPEPEFVVIQALPKGDRGELAVALMTEVGVDLIVPWEASRCVTRWHEARGVRSLQRWRSAAREASKQSRRLRMTQVAELTTTRDVCAILVGAELPIVLHERAEHGFSTLELPRRGRIALVVGPEGGLTDAELQALRAAGGHPVRLGEAILRTSTAGAASVSALAAAVGRWG